MIPDPNKVKSNIGSHTLEQNDTTDINDEIQGKRKILPLKPNALAKSIINKGKIKTCIAF
jgi:hypothetical protein